MLLRPARPALFIIIQSPDTIGGYRVTDGHRWVCACACRQKQGCPACDGDHEGLVPAVAGPVEVTVQLNLFCRAATDEVWSSCDPRAIATGVRRSLAVDDGQAERLARADAVILDMRILADLVGSLPRTGAAHGGGVTVDWRGALTATWARVLRSSRPWRARSLRRWFAEAQGLGAVDPVARWRRLPMSRRCRVWALVRGSKTVRRTASTCPGAAASTLARPSSVRVARV